MDDHWSTFTGTIFADFCTLTTSANERYQRSTELLCGYAVMHLMNPQFHKLGSLRKETTCYSCYSCHGRCVSRCIKHSKESESMKPLTSKLFNLVGPKVLGLARENHGLSSHDFWYGVTHTHTHTHDSDFPSTSCLDSFRSLRLGHLKWLPP